MLDIGCSYSIIKIYKLGSLSNYSNEYYEDNNLEYWLCSVFKYSVINETSKSYCPLQWVPTN